MWHATELLSVCHSWLLWKWCHFNYPLFVSEIQPHFRVLNHLKFFCEWLNVFVILGNVCWIMKAKNVFSHFSILIYKYFPFCLLTLLMIFFSVIRNCNFSCGLSNYCFSFRVTVDSWTKRELGALNPCTVENPCTDYKGPCVSTDLTGSGLSSTAVFTVVKNLPISGALQFKPVLLGSCTFCACQCP